MKLNLIDPELFAGIGTIIAALPTLMTQDRPSMEQLDDDLNAYWDHLMQREKNGEVGPYFEGEGAFTNQPTYFFMGL